MKKIVLILAASLLLFFGCNSEKEKAEENLPSGVQKITVTEHMDGGGYTFIKGDFNGKEQWIATNQTPVENGKPYYFTDAMEMTNFESKSLKRTFESILFVNQISETPPTAGNQHKNLNPAEEKMLSSSDHTKPKVEAQAGIHVEPVAGGITVATVNKDRKSLVGKTVKIKGVITKYNGGIMGKNWLHIQDGSKDGDAVDVTVTTDQPAKIGETVVVEGTVAIDKDFGAGYYYDVIIENAKVTEAKKI